MNRDDGSPAAGGHDRDFASRRQTSTPGNPAGPDIGPDLDDAMLRERLQRALAPMTPPTYLSARIERMAAVGLPASGPAEEARRARAANLAPAFSWGDLLPALAGVPLLLGLLAGAARFLLGTLRDAPATTPLPINLQALPSLPLPPIVAVVSLMLPLGILLGIEALRGAPTLRRWLR